MSLLLLPHNIPDSLKHLSSLIDDIWYHAGDRSTDVSGSQAHSYQASLKMVSTFKGYKNPYNKFFQFKLILRNFITTGPNPLFPFPHHPPIICPATTKVNLDLQFCQKSSDNNRHRLFRRFATLILIFICLFFCR